MVSKKQEASYTVFSEVVSRLCCFFQSPSTTVILFLCVILFLRVILFLKIRYALKDIVGKCELKDQILLNDAGNRPAFDASVPLLYPVFFKINSF